MIENFSSRRQILLILRNFCNGHLAIILGLKDRHTDMMKLGYAGLNLIMCTVLQVIAVLGNYFSAVFSPHSFAFREAARLSS
jgi:hypothetical protein